MSNSPRYGTNNQNTSKYMSDLLNEFVKMPRGVFNETRRKIMDVGIFDIIPIECFEMLPNSEAYLQYDIQMLSKNPTVKRLLSSMNCELRVYQIDYNDIWNGWNNFITKGRSGRIVKEIPALDYSLGTTDKTTCLPYNPAFTLGLAPAVFCGKDETVFNSDVNKRLQSFADLQVTGLTGISTVAALKSSKAMRISALPFVMYNKIAKKYLTSNLLQDNPHWFPENEDHDQYLPYDCPELVTTSDYLNPAKAFSSESTIDPSQRQNTGKTDYTSYPWLNVLWKAQRKGDYFNTGSPFPDLIRGDIPTLSILNATLNTDAFSLANLKLKSTIDTSSSPNGIQLNNAYHPLFYRPPYDEFVNGMLASGSISSDGKYISVNNPVKLFDNMMLQSGKINVSDNAIQGLQFSMRQWRQLATMTVMRERMALTDGSYNQLIKAMFGFNPKWHEHDVKYCGGFNQPIVFSEVVNTSESSSAPLGDTAGRAFSTQVGGTIHVRSNDFGMFMTVICIKTDDYYSQGVDKMFSRLTNEEQYFPILNNLSPDRIQNKELYISGNDSKDEDTFNYQERFAYYKSRRNQVSGLMALPISKVGDVGAYLVNRLFSDTPNFNQEFSLGHQTANEKAIFASVDQAEFTAVIGCHMKYIAPIPEDSRPSDMGISY